MPLDRVSPFPAPPGTVMPLPTVLLHHDLPDGSWHVDWMLAADRATTRGLITFRLPGPLTDLAPGASVAATRLPDHRPSYLSYEGPVSGGRGEVRRLRRGRVESWRDGDDGHELLIIWEGDTGRPDVRATYRLEPREDDRWRVSRTGESDGSGTSAARHGA